MLACNLQAGDEVVIPSFTFSSTATALANLGAKPVFVDVRQQDLCINADLVEDAITERTKAVIAVHYAGIIAPMDQLREITERRGLILIEDAAQALLSKRSGAFAGSFGSLACLSFHYTKNVTCGEGGAILVNDDEVVQRVEIAREKGTDRSRFLRGSVDKYTWRSLGTSGILAEPLAAILWKQLQSAELATRERQTAVEAYAKLLGPLEQEGYIRLPVLDPENPGNGHFFFVLLNSPEQRVQLLAYLNERAIQATSHYEPLHLSPYASEHYSTESDMAETVYAASRIVRLPTWPGVGSQTQRIVGAIYDFFGVPCINEGLI